MAADKPGQKTPPKTSMAAAAVFGLEGLPKPAAPTPGGAYPKRELETAPPAGPAANPISPVSTVTPIGGPERTVDPAPAAPTPGAKPPITAEDTGKEKRPAKVGIADPKLRKIHCSRITIHPLHNREEYVGIEELTQSMTAGQAQPCSVRPHPTKQGMFELFIGGRRWHAARERNADLLCQVYEDVSDEDIVGLMHRENADRMNTNVFEDASWYRKLIDSGKFDAYKLAELLGCTRNAIYERLRLTEIDASIREAIRVKKIGSRFGLEAALELRELDKTGYRAQLILLLDEVAERKQVNRLWLRQRCFQLKSNPTPDVRKRRRTSVKVVNQDGKEIARMRKGRDGSRTIIIRPNLVGEETVEGVLDLLRKAAGPTKS